MIWEPTASRLVQEGLARRAVTGVTPQENDGGFLAMRADLIKQRPDIVKAWMNAELDAQLFIADSKNAAEVVKIAKEQTTGFTEKVLWSSLYGSYGADQDGSKVRNQLHYTITPQARELLTRATAFLFEIKSINTAVLRPEAVMPEFAEAVLKERNIKAPIGVVNALPESAFKPAN